MARFLVWVLAALLAASAAAQGEKKTSEVEMAFATVSLIPPPAKYDVARRVRLAGQVSKNQALVGRVLLPYSGHFGPYIRFVSRGGAVVGPEACAADLVALSRAVYEAHLHDDPYFELLHKMAQMLVQADDRLAYTKTGFRAYPDEKPMDQYASKPVEMFLLLHFDELLRVARALDSAVQPHDEL
jgi:hypothetical protein